MDESWQARLKRMGVIKGARALNTPPRRPFPAEKAPYGGEPVPLTRLLPGLQLVPASSGGCLARDRVYPLHHRHGPFPLQALLQHDPALAGPFSGEPRLQGLDFRRFLLLDTETTGLAGAGTLAFLVGVAFFEGEAFVVRQFFLRDQGDEPAMLAHLASLLQERAGLITFNGRTFDVPLLDQRYLLNRMDDLGASLRALPHLDLLPAARRLWRLRLGSVALGNLERELLRFQRSQEDVPGALIPRLYFDYLQHGDGREMARVFYHNEIDLLSMVGVASLLLDQLAAPGPVFPALDLLSLGTWRERLGDVAGAEEAYRQALAGELPAPVFQRALGSLASLLKRQERWEEAVTLWQQMAVTSYGDVSAHVELAKYFEWREPNLPLAQLWTERALALANRWPAARATLVQQELDHRLARLQRKRGRNAA